MSVGFVILAHTALDRAAQVARHLASAGCPIVIHVDKRVTQDQEKRLRGILRAFGDVRFCQRFKCDWGTWSIVAASKSGAEMMLKDFPDVDHVYLTSGSCMPLRPLPELMEYRAEHPVPILSNLSRPPILRGRWTDWNMSGSRFISRFRGGTNGACTTGSSAFSADLAFADGRRPGLPRTLGRSGGA